MRPCHGSSTLQPQTVAVPLHGAVGRIKLDKTERARWKRQRRTGDALPARAQAVVETGRALVTEAKGRGKAK